MEPTIINKNENTFNDGPAESAKQKHYRYTYQSVRGAIKNFENTSFTNTLEFLKNI